MVKWFKRAEVPRVQEARRAPAVRSAAPAHGPEADTVPAALPEVLAEGNSQDDWSAWEDSMAALDSQFQGLVDPATRIQVRDTRPSQLEAADAFAHLGRRRDL